MKNKQENGQVGLVVLLITVVLLTVGVSVASRSVSELKLSRQEQESTRVLDVAESGIEDLLSKPLVAGSTGTNINIPGVGNYDYRVDSSNELHTRIEKGHTAELTLDPTNPSQFDLAWTHGCAGAAVEITMIADGTHVSRLAYDDCAARSSGAGGNNFTDPGSIPKTVNFTGRMIRIKVLYQAATIDITNSNLPTQTYTIRTSSTNLSDGTTRAVEVTKPVAALPSIFDYVLFSGSTLIK